MNNRFSIMTEITDMATDGQFSEAIEKIPLQDKTINALLEEIARFQVIAVLALRAKNMGLEEISAKLKMSFTEVAAILDAAGKDK
ncbi:MAG: hypothetical protein LBO66_08890 [Deltaproteobacteria bacterium]|jgi:hypothetical protein|nr:hypothetical protein [Deltaproteobacteria bacterium]